MKIDTYVLLLEHPSRFGLRISSGGSAATYLRVVTLPEMTDSQVLRLALDNISDLLKRLKTTGATVNVHLYDLSLIFCEGDLLVAGELLQESIDRLEALLTSPKDLRFVRSPDGASMI